MSQNPLFPVPVVHELGYYMHYPDLNMYFATVNYVMESVEDLKKCFIELGGRTFKFSGYQGGLINPKTGKLAFEYKLSWRDAVGASKCSFTIKPMFGPNTKTKTGKIASYKGIGTQVEVKSSFIEPDQARTFYEAFLLHIDAGRFIPLLDLNKSTIFQGAVHVRYHEQHEPDVVRMLQKIEDENNTLGDVKVTKNKIAGKWDMFYLHEPDLSVCNIPKKWPWHLGLKTYRIKEFWKRKYTDCLYHPKFEIFLHGGDNPSLAQYKDFIRDMRDTLIQLLSFVGPMEYLSDMYFDADKLMEYRTALPKWDYENIQPVELDNLGLQFRPEKSLSVLAYVANQPEGCTTYQSISESLNIPERTLYRHVNYWIELGILVKKKTRYLLVGFESASLWRAIKGPVLNVCALLDITFKKQWGQFFTDPGIIQRFRKPKQELMPFKVTEGEQKQLITVDDWRKADALKAQLKKEGVSHLFKIGVTSNKSSMRYSRVIG